MLPSSNPDLHPLIRKLDSIFDLTAEERHGIAKLQVTIRNLKADQDIVRDGDRPSQCCLILEGFAFRYKALEGGKRQIFSFHIPGDIPDLQSLHLTVMDHALATLTAGKVAFIQHETMRSFLHAHPRISDAFWRDTLVDAAVFREWMVGIGRRDAPTRIAHLFCEMFVRMQAVGLAEDYTCNLPITQTELADALGLSTVHVNRSLMALRATGTVDVAKGKLIVKDWAGLQEAGEFDPTYLHLRPPAAMAA
ncbi:MAG TPA: Crp/Fnr family transcriptional regulator [Beijerinckiaceae bacterium]|jgi:CRP-like cAMP-binding protein